MLSGMKAGKALVIFSDINNGNYSIEEKQAAILKILSMPTHNGVKKEWMLEVIQWLWDRDFNFSREA